MTHIDRSWRRTAKAERALGLDGLPRRRLHQRTLARMLAVLGREEEFRDAAVGAALVGLLDKLSQSDRKRFKL